MAGPRFILAIDQGTTSTRAMLFDAEGASHGQAQRELKQSYPQSGWVEHDPEEIWSATVETGRAVLAQAKIDAGDIAGIGITNQRETTVLWERSTGRPIAPAIVWQDRRTAALCETLTEAGHADAVQAKTGLIIDSYFSATKIAWLLDNVAGARTAAERGELAFGTIDCFLLWRLTGGAVHATDATNAARTMLFDIHRQDWDDDLLASVRACPRSLLPDGPRQCRGIRWHRRRLLRPLGPDRRHGRRPAGGDDRPGLLRARHDQVDLRHRLLHRAQHRQRRRALARTAC